MRNHVLPLLSFQKLIDHVEGTLLPPTATIELEGKSTSNRSFSTWKEADQEAYLTLQSSFSEGTMYETIGL